MPSAGAIEWTLLDHAAPQPVRVGDVVSAEAGGMPIYRVLAVGQSGAVLEHDTSRTTLVLPLDRFRWRG
jgi:hypothetical protein